MSIEEQNKAIAKRYYQEIMTEGKLDVIDELMAPDFLFTIPTHPEPFIGPEGFKTLVKMLHSAFLGMSIVPSDLIAEGDTVCGRWTGKGNFAGGPLLTVLGPVPAPGKPFEIDGMTWLTFANGKITKSLANEDTFGLLKQTGIIP